MTEIFFFGPDNNQVEAEGAVRKKFSLYKKPFLMPNLLGKNIWLHFFVEGKHHHCQWWRARGSGRATKIVKQRNLRKSEKAAEFN